jgi:hypothetical protein
VQAIEETVRELLLRGFSDDALEVIRLNESIAVLVEEVASLADALAL